MGATVRKQRVGDPGLGRVLCEERQEVPSDPGCDFHPYFDEWKGSVALSFEEGLLWLRYHPCWRLG